MTTLFMIATVSGLAYLVGYTIGFAIGLNKEATRNEGEA